MKPTSAVFTVAVAITALLLSHAGTAAASPSALCDAERLGAIPPRPSDAPAGSEFAREVRTLSGVARDERVRSEILAGNIPTFLRHLVPVTLSVAASAGQAVSITLCTLPDYLAVGSDKDFLYVSLGLEAALSVAERIGSLLPTPKIVDAIYAQSSVQLSPQPLPAGEQMRSTDYLIRHNELIDEQRAALGVAPGELTAGHKKDLVLTERLWQHPGQVAIYGWHRGEGAPIQPLSTVHGARYADYSHGVRLVSLNAYVNGSRRTLPQILADPQLSALVSKEGPLLNLSERLGQLADVLRQPAAFTR